MEKFNQASYLSQVRSLRELGEIGLKQYKIKVEKLSFITHGENTTFRVFTKSKQYLLRIHRFNYHKPEALEEELQWLEAIRDDGGIQAQKPILTRDGNLNTHIETAKIESGRYCDLLEWQLGQIKYNHFNNTDFKKLAELTANLHSLGEKFKSNHRKYWSAKGLIGNRAKFGSLIKMKNFWGKDYDLMEEARKLLLDKLSGYEKKNRQNQIMIHADLHFGNIIWKKGNPKPIDFDDCGVGSTMYDVAVTYYSAERYFKEIGFKKGSTLWNHYLDYYSKYRPLSQNDVNIISYYVLARKMAMLLWLYDRSDNSKLQSRLKETKSKNVKLFREFIKKEL